MKREHTNATIAIMGVLAVILTAHFSGALWASGLAVLMSLWLALRTPAAQAGMRAVRYARLERKIRAGRGTAAEHEGGRDRYGLQGATVDPEDETGCGFRVAGISFDRDARASDRFARQNRVRTFDTLPAAVRARDEAGPRLPQMVAQRRVQLENERSARHLPDDADPRCKGR